MLPYRYVSTACPLLLSQSCTAPLCVAVYHLFFSRIAFLTGLLSSLSCPSLQRHFAASSKLTPGSFPKGTSTTIANNKHQQSLQLAKSFRLTESAREAVADAAAAADITGARGIPGGRGLNNISTALSATPTAILPSDLDDMARRHERAQVRVVVDGGFAGPWGGEGGGLINWPTVKGYQTTVLPVSECRRLFSALVPMT